MRSNSTRPHLLLVAVVLAAMLAAACTEASGRTGRAGPTPTGAAGP
jgi:hypothetical protein